MTSCASYKIPTESFYHVPCETFCEEQGKIEREALQHPLYTLIPRHRSQIKWYDIGHWCTWMLFGNDDDGIFGEGPAVIFKKAEPITSFKALKWICRNPLHNFSFYVLGTAYTTNSEFALIKLQKNKCDLLKYKKQSEGNDQKSSYFFLGFHGWKPFIFLRVLYSQKYKGQWYLGWRERGNFGIMFLPLTTIKPHDLKSEIKDYGKSKKNI